MANFDKAADLVLRHEGTYVNNPSDPGGETSYGISKRAYPNLDIKKLTRRDAIEIYRRDYWMPIAGDRIESQTLAANLFDFAVTSGVGTAVRVMQRLVNVIPDGKVGPLTLQAINNAQPVHTNLCLISERCQFYIGLAAGKPGLRFALHSWLHRVADYARA